MGFSGLMGFVGGAARAGEEVANANLVRMDAQGLAQARAQAEFALEERVNQNKISAEKRGYARDDFKTAQGLMQKKQDTADALKAKHDEIAYNQDPANIAKAIAAKNQEATDSIAGQESTAKTRAEINARNAQAEKDRAEAKKALAEIGNGGAKPLSENDVAARVTVGDKGLRVAYNIGTDPVTGQFTGKAEDIKGYLTAFAKLERAVRNNESLPAAYVEKLFSGTETEKSTAKAASDERAQRGIDNLNNNKPTLRFKDYTREEFDAMPQEEQDKAISQGKAPNAPKQESASVTAIPKASLKGGEERGGYVWDAKLGRAVPVKPQASAPAAPAQEHGLMQRKPDTPAITVSKQPLALQADGSKLISNIPKDGKFYQNVIYRDGEDRFEVDAQGNRKEVGASSHKVQAKAAKVDSKPMPQVDDDVAQAEAELAQAKKEQAEANARSASNETRRKKEKEVREAQDRLNEARRQEELASFNKGNN